MRSRFVASLKKSKTRSIGSGSSSAASKVWSMRSAVRGNIGGQSKPEMKRMMQRALRRGLCLEMLIQKLGHFADVLGGQELRAAVGSAGDHDQRAFHASLFQGGIEVLALLKRHQIVVIAMHDEVWR